MILFQIFAAIVTVFVRALLALIVYPVWILVVIVTSPLRIVSPKAHQWVAGKSFNLALGAVFLGHPKH